VVYKRRSIFPWKRLDIDLFIILVYIVAFIVPLVGLGITFFQDDWPLLGRAQRARGEYYTAVLIVVMICVLNLLDICEKRVEDWEGFVARGL